MVGALNGGSPTMSCGLNLDLENEVKFRGPEISIGIAALHLALPIGRLLDSVFLA